MGAAQAYGFTRLPAAHTRLGVEKDRSGASSPWSTPQLSTMRREVIVGQEGVRREIRPFHRNDKRRIRLLRVDHLLEERVLRGLIGHDLVPASEELTQD